MSHGQLLSRRTILAQACLAAPAFLLARAALGQINIDSSRFKAAETAIEAAIADGKIPGAVLCAGRKAGVVYLKSFGNRAVEPEKVEMTDDTVFDLASLSKPVATATSVMLLAERGKLNLNDRVSQYLPAFAANGKENVTIEQLLLHRGGVVADNSIKDYENTTPEVAMKRTLESHVRYEPGKGYIYSDVGFIALGELVKVVSGQPLNVFASENLFKPLGMTSTMHLPTDDLKKRCAPTEKRGGKWMIGEVHDPRAWALGGFAGHAGLFGTAGDLARYCRMLMGGGELDGVRVLKESTVAEMTQPRPLELPDGVAVRGYGFDIDTKYSAPRGERFTKGKSFGHTGFTGTSLWIDAENDAFVILLTNAIHPKDKGKPISDLRRTVGTAVANAMLPPIGDKK